MLRTRCMPIGHVMQLYDLLLVCTSLQMRRIVRLRTTSGTSDVRPRAFPAHDAAHGAHQAAEYSVLDKFAHDGADGRRASSENTDLDLDERPNARCGDTNWENLVNDQPWSSADLRPESMILSFGANLV